jgi:hypothetical protein
MNTATPLIPGAHCCCCSLRRPRRSVCSSPKERPRRSKPLYRMWMRRALQARALGYTHEATQVDPKGRTRCSKPARAVRIACSCYEPYQSGDSASRTAGSRYRRRQKRRPMPSCHPSRCRSRRAARGYRLACRRGMAASNDGILPRYPLPAPALESPNQPP